MADFNKRKGLSVKELQGIIPHDPKREPASIEDMDKAIARAVRKGNVPESGVNGRGKKRLKLRWS